MGGEYAGRQDDDDWSFDFPMFAVLHPGNTSAVLPPDRTFDENGSTTSDFESSWVATACG